MHIRKARLSDVENIYRLVNNYADKGEMLSRPRSLIYEYIRDFVIIEIDDKVVGTGALHILWDDLAEIRALAVEEDQTRRGIGRGIVEYCLQEAKELGIPKVFALTYQPDFFAKCGFRVISKDNLPQKVWRDCINCPKFPNCDEVCMEIQIN